MSAPDRQEITDAHIQGLYEDVARLQKAVDTMAWWLVQAQTGFGEQDARGISDILNARPAPKPERKERDG